MNPERKTYFRPSTPLGEQARIHWHEKNLHLVQIPASTSKKLPLSNLHQRNFSVNQVDFADLRVKLKKTSADLPKRT